MTELPPRSARLVERWLLWDTPSFSHLFLFCNRVLNLIPLFHLTDFPLLSVLRGFIIHRTQVSGSLCMVLDSVYFFSESYTSAQMESPDPSQWLIWWEQQKQVLECSLTHKTPLWEIKIISFCYCSLKNNQCFSVSFLHPDLEFCVVYKLEI